MIAWGRNMSNKDIGVSEDQTPYLESPKFRPHGLGLFCFVAVRKN